MIRRILIGILLVLGAALHAFAGTTGKITGIVKDSQTGEPVIGASVTIEGTSQGAATNLDGYFVILNVAPGTYRVSASGVGYIKKITSDVKVSIDLTTRLDISIASTVVNVGEEVVVTAERAVLKKDLTSSEAHVDAAAIKSMPVREVNDVLQLQAGITVDRGGGVHIRGGRSSEVTYWVDGVSVSDMYDGSQSVQVDNNAVQELQVISGTFNAEYGQAMAGIVNIVTKDGDQSYRGSVSAYAGGYATPDKVFYNLGKFDPVTSKNAEASLSGPMPLMNALTFYVSGRYFKSNGYLFGNRTFNPDGTLASGASYVRDATGALLYVAQPNSPVSMNGRERFSGQAKLTVPITGSMKLAVTGIGSKIDYSDYDHGRRLVPDGNVTKHDRGYSVSAVLTHSLSSSAFYTVNLSYFNKSFREYLYENPLDTRYVLDPSLTTTGVNEWLHGGDNLHQFYRRTETREAKLDFTDQVSELHQLKFGAEGKLHRLYLKDYSVQPFSDTMRVNGNLVNYYRPTIPDPTSYLFQEYTEKPVEVSAYLQDKLEYQHMVVNIGVRVDYFKSNGRVLADPNDPNVYLPQKDENKSLTLAQRQAKWYKIADPKWSISPRFGISYPITDRGILHFSYGHFTQIPSFMHLFQSPDYKVNAVDAIQGVYGNPNLNPQKTVMYEFGLQQQVTESMSADFTGFYRDTRDWVTAGAPVPVRDPTGQTSTTEYTTYVNRDYANSRGITLSVTQRPIGLFSFNASYTFQVAEGSNSNPDEEQGALTANKEPAKTLAPLEWDQTHTFNINVGFGEQDWGVFLLGRYGSGLPYTPVINQAEGRGEDAARVVTKNSRRLPPTYTVDLRLFKNFKLGSTTLSVFAKVFNLLDQRNAVGYFGETGTAEATVAQLGLSGVGGTGRVNSVADYIVRPDFYSEPREVQVGFEFNF
jgi:outer membrane receptor for ferrienterochelin and colicin